MAPRSEIPDTTVFIAIAGDPHVGHGTWRKIRSGRAWLSAVVAAELYAGARSREESAALDQFVTTMQRTGRLLTPTSDDWTAAGRLIARQSRLAGAVRARDHLADVLILVSAARLGGTVVTANVRHFRAWARLARAAGLDVTVTPFPV